ncbi:MAG: class I adenylate-forming enzyme family protein [Gemmatimonadaceae bacterium]
MSNPLALLPLAIAAGGGTVDGFEAQQLVAAGLTLLQRSAPLVRALAGRRSAILLPTSPAFLTALAASEGHGAVLVNPLAAPAEVAHQCADANVGAVFTIGLFADRVPEGLVRVLLDAAPRTATVIAGGTAREVDLGAHFGLDLVGSTDEPGRREEAAIVYTSAMQGTPLGAILTHRNLIANGRSTVEAGQFTPMDHTLALLPWSHLFGLTVTASAPLFASGRVTTMGRFHPARAAELLVGGEVTAVVGVPAVFHALVQALERRETPSGGALRLAICGGAVLPVWLQDRWTELTGVELRQGYGLTEAGPVCLFNRTDLPNRRGTLGVAFPRVEVRIAPPVAGDTTPLGAGEEGEIIVRGDNVSPGYVSAGELGLVHERDGWLRTGDLGASDADGCVRFRGLAKPMFTRTGFNVYPAELERVIAAMPGVRAVRVRAMPEPSREHDIAIEVAGDVTEDAVKAWCQPRLAAYKQPSEIRVNR